jgi:hypothetical protein
MSWIREHIVFFIEGVLGHEYKEVTEEAGGRENTISKEPTAWCFAYEASARKFLDRKIPYAGSVDCLDYFVSALGHASNASIRKFLDPSVLLSRSEIVLSQSDAPSIVLEFAQNIQNRKNDIMENWKASGE